MTVSKALFGGALMAAGVSANAQNFIYQATDSTGSYQSFAYSYIPYSAGFDISYDSGNLNTYAIGSNNYFGTTAAWTTQTADNIRVSGRWDGGGNYGYGYGGNFLQQFFQVSADTQLLIEWDFEGTDGYASTFVIEDPSLGVLFSLDGTGGDPFSGSALVDVSAGEDYALQMGMIAGFFPYYYDAGAEEYINVSIVPAPASVALLAGAGLVATRRRR